MKSPHQVTRHSTTWKLKDAKARFSKVVRRPREGVPQRVSVRDEDAVVVLSAADFACLAPAASGNLAAPFVSSPLARLDDFEAGVVRERVPMRDSPPFDQ